ncbi:MAG TPA: DUF4301 domain-containing protein [Prevotellaceae bacterium]|nr:DUF4301 domain-containing protein [Prevotellaceae bacterium]
MTLTPSDEAQLRAQGITREQLMAQLECFRKGFPYMKLQAAASVPDDILSLTSESQEQYVQKWDEYKAQGHKITKFVPASGAASRMFKDLYAFLESGRQAPSGDVEKTFFGNLRKFAFYDALNDACVLLYGMGAESLVEEQRCHDVAEALLGNEGLGYGSLPKGLLQFHSYADCARTPVEEHLTEAALYASSQGEADVHFTVSHEHRELFEELIDRVLPEYEERFRVTYHVSLSEQLPSTDTVAANEDGTPFRTDDGRLLFRPGGHGALIHNLDALDSDVVFIKNIDNVVPDVLKADTVHWKQVLAGVLVSVQEQAFRYMRLLDSGTYSHDDLEDIIRFVRHTLHTDMPGLKHMEDTELSVWLRSRLNRPIRVCGMVRNVGEPGGGPFLAYNPDGSVSLQILESSQIDPENAETQAMFRHGTHFNPVDLVCAVRDLNGKHFSLPDFVDPATGFISHKSKDGRPLLALELPGLWNGAMSNWSTIMVEVPLSTFNPVKTVNDLLRPQHQAKSGVQ